MYEQVGGEGGGALEDFPTHRTAERPLLKQQGGVASVSRPVCVQFLEHVALTLTLHGDCSRMDLDRRALFE